jgi:adenylate cyclase
MASFSSASRAIGCSLGIQESVAERVREGHGQDLGVRIGLNAGEPVSEDGPDGRADLFGTAVQLASRICEAAEPGQVLVSDVIRQLAAGKGYDFEGRGNADLKGFPDPVPLFKVTAPEAAKRSS